MVNLSVTSSVMIEEGPAFSLASELEAESYAVATVTLDQGASRDVSLLPQDGTPVLLAVRAITVSGGHATVRVRPNPSETGDGEQNWIRVAGTLLISGADVLKGLGTPRALGIENTGAEPATVDILSCLDLS
ncbi:hypothetical protein [Streptomyces sp. JHA26]|uniref:hypothetical protein n=1 Tax=Streptomyces sp. JHA26 TaxID=1917143 RepID=UPI00098AF86E|nr:hypothetical protein [Streptomyces sp. JHA26]